MLHVPYSSNPLVVTDLLGVRSTFSSATCRRRCRRSGPVRLKGFAVRACSARRLRPTFRRSIEADFRLRPDRLVCDVCSCKNPEAGGGPLNAALREALADKDVASKLLAAGIEPVASSPDELKAFVMSETEKWAKIVKDAKIEPE